MAEPSKCMPSSKARLQLGGSDGETLQLAQHVGEPEPDESDAAFLDRAQHVVLLTLHGAMMQAHRAPWPCFWGSFTWRSHLCNRIEMRLGRSCPHPWPMGVPTRPPETTEVSVTYKAEYIWIDGTEPTAELRSKTKIIPDGAELGIWGFDGSSTNQAPGDNSDCVLQPVFTCPDPIRGGDNVLVLCEVQLTADLTPHPTNTRAHGPGRRRQVRRPGADLRHRAGVHDSSTASGWPLGFPAHGFPGPQGPYYCGVGADEIVRSRHRRGAHSTPCIEAGLAISGTNAEVMPGQWEFQVGPVDTARRSPTTCGSPAGCSTASPRSSTSPISIDPKPVKGDWNGAGVHTNFSTNGDARGLRRRSSPPARRSASSASPRSTSPTTAPASRTASPACTRPPRGPSSATACRTAAPRSASRGRSPRTGKGYIEDRRPERQRRSLRGRRPHDQHGLRGAGLGLPSSPQERHSPGSAWRKATPGCCAPGVTRGREPMEERTPQRSSTTPGRRAWRSSTSASATCPGLMQHFSVPLHELTEDELRGGSRLRRLVDPRVPGDPGVGHDPDRPTPTPPYLDPFTSTRR